MSNLDHVLQQNADYANTFGARASLSHFPRRKAAVLTCMDCRLEPTELMGMELGEVHVIRNAGGRASDDAIRSLVVSYKLLGTKEFYVIHHTNCGMASVTDKEIADLLSGSLSPAVRTESGLVNAGDLPGSVEGFYIDWLTIDSEPKALLDDVSRIKSHSLIPNDILVYAMMYDVKTGALEMIDSE